MHTPSLKDLEALAEAQRLTAGNGKICLRVVVSIASRAAALTSTGEEGDYEDQLMLWGLLVSSDWAWHLRRLLIWMEEIAAAKVPSRWASSYSLQAKSCQALWVVVDDKVEKAVCDMPELDSLEP